MIPRHALALLLAFALLACAYCSRTSYSVHNQAGMATGAMPAVSPGTHVDPPSETPIPRAGEWLERQEPAPALEPPQVGDEDVGAYGAIARYEWITARTARDRQRAMAWALLELPSSNVGLVQEIGGMALAVRKESPRWHTWAMVSACPVDAGETEPLAWSGFDCGTQQAWRELVENEPENLGAWLALDALQRTEDQERAQTQLWHASRLETAPEVLLPPLKLPQRVLDYIATYHRGVSDELVERTGGNPEWGLALTFAGGVREMGMAIYFAASEGGWGAAGYGLGERVTGDLMTARSLYLADALVAFACQKQPDAKMEQECWDLSEIIGGARQSVNRRMADDSSAFMDGLIESLEEGRYREVTVEDF